jgi:hypothetical protein
MIFPFPGATRYLLSKLSAAWARTPLLSVRFSSLSPDRVSLIPAQEAITCTLAGTSWGKCAGAFQGYGIWLD